MTNSDLESSSLREDRFELASILRTFQKQQQNLILDVLDDDNVSFKLIRMEGSVARLLPLNSEVSLRSPVTLVAEGTEAKIILALPM